MQCCIISGELNWVGLSEKAKMSIVSWLVQRNVMSSCWSLYWWLWLCRFPRSHLAKSVAEDCGNDFKTDLSPKCQARVTEITKNLLFIKLDMYKGGSNLQIDVPPNSQVYVLMHQNQLRDGIKPYFQLYFSSMQPWVTRATMHLRHSTTANMTTFTTQDLDSLGAWGHWEK